MGFYGSNMCGSGLTYVLHTPSGLGFHASFIGWNLPDNVFFNVGGAVTQDISKQPWDRVYGLLAGGYAIGSGGALPNIAPGIGVDMNGLFGEVGYSFYPDPAKAGSGGFSSLPTFGLGVRWKL
ncbi:MAG: hypothetical protein VKS61_13355 [Candidatus Sericytochromatia bacterium]|nr:hypothetical protein [Candidatus Sericytochromatia bacterium]